MEVSEVTTATFSHEVLEADKPVLVGFWTPICQPCRALMPTVEALAQHHANDLKVVKVNATARENWRLCREQGVTGLPLYLLFRRGQVVRRMIGAQVTAQTLAETVEEVINAAQAK